VFKIFYLEC
jgi:hypothetical protein